MKSLINFCFLVIICNSIQSQIYLIDSTNFKAFDIQGELLFEDGSKYSYDDQERLISIKNSNSYFTYTYLDQQTNITRYDEYGAFISENRLYYNANGFSTLSEKYTGTIDNQELEAVDSIYRSESGQINVNNSYEVEGGQLIPIYKLSNTYFPNDDFMTRTIEYYFDGQIYQTYSLVNTQDKDEKIILGVETNNDYYYGTNVDSSFYTNFDDYRNVLEKTYSEDQLLRCEISEWTEYDQNYREQLISESDDCIDFVVGSLNENYLSDDKLTGLDSVKRYRYLEGNDIFLDNAVYHTQDGVLGDDILDLNISVRRYEDAGQYRENHTFRRLFKSQSVDTKDQSLADLKLNVFPNPVSSSQPLKFRTDAIKYNSVKILDQAGRTVLHIPASSQQNTVIAPSEPGIYFIRLYNKFESASRAVKVVVQ